jgi:hypothetical protein
VGIDSRQLVIFGLATSSLTHLLTYSRRDCITTTRQR